MSKAKITASGSCLCDSVTFTVSGIDKGAVLCHCSNCRKASGSAFAHNHRFLDSTLTFDKGGDLVKEYADHNTKSGNSLLRHFCSNCGSNLYLRNPNFPSLVIIHCALLTDSSRSHPKMELFPENRRAWLDEVPKAKM